ncbi:hypothetical protein [Halobacillus andaensis]|uniref:hypothetical protein n=1 Tax=Halobacillus andaensis TaxID=1176239 RepID=UPI003D7177AC
MKTGFILGFIAVIGTLFVTVWTAGQAFHKKEDNRICCCLTYTIYYWLIVSKHSSYVAEPGCCIQFNNLPFFLIGELWKVEILEE